MCVNEFKNKQLETDFLEIEYFVVGTAQYTRDTFRARGHLAATHITIKKAAREAVPSEKPLTHTPYKNMCEYVHTTR
jgi:hypothetical protein